ncbi:hypothetical protein CASFOL_012852 [Castilleja foliolosa]|uniref:Methyltransferase n=1 Tax=Castilleja foliolosa TaxID=1961234 RepID=A0ABD3DK38_9LAMI
MGEQPRGCGAPVQARRFTANWVSRIFVGLIMFSCRWWFSRLWYSAALDEVGKWLRDDDEQRRRGKSVPEIAWGKRSRVVLDVGCGIASFGGFLFDRDVLTMSLAPKDEHEAQVQFALERGIPAISAVMGTSRLPYPGKVFDVVHCARCRVPWHIEGIDGGVWAGNSAHGLAISNKHTYMFSAGDDKLVKCCILEQNKVIRSCDGHLSSVYSLALHPTIDVLLTGGRDSVCVGHSQQKANSHTVWRDTVFDICNLVVGLVAEKDGDGFG